MLKANYKNNTKYSISLEVEFHLEEGKWFFHPGIGVFGFFRLLPANENNQEETIDTEGSKKKNKQLFFFFFQKGQEKYRWAIQPLSGQSDQIYPAGLKHLGATGVVIRHLPHSGPGTILGFRLWRSVRKGGKRTPAVRKGGASCCLSNRAEKGIGQLGRAGKAIGQLGRAGRFPRQRGRAWPLLALSKGRKSPQLARKSWFLTSLYCHVLFVLTSWPFNLTSKNEF